MAGRLESSARIAAPPAAGGTIHHLFEAQVDRHPHRLACTHGAESLTYGELDRRANRLAHRLRALGVGRDACVAVCLDRSLDMLVAILGALKAGGAYVPLDPEHPAARRAFAVEDSRSPVLVSRRSLWSADRPPATARLFCLDEEAAALDMGPSGRPAAGSRPEDLAYVIYTSGSSGVPKGCMVTHRNVTRLFTSAAAWFDFGPLDSWTLFHSLAFDFSVWETFGALLHGGRVVVVPFAVSRSPEATAQLVAEERITIFNQTPSAFRQVSAAILKAGGTTALRHVIFGGEALAFRSLRAWCERFGAERPRLVNMYGITETTVHVTCRPVTLQDVFSSGPSLIGPPLPDLELWLWNDRREPVAAGEMGEICVAGPGVARGYLNRPELDRERFLTRDGKRIYCSGDLGRRLPNGDVEYLGRGDGQVKIRGFRVETGEIAARILDQGDVADAVVRLAQPAGAAAPARLVAYCIVRPGRRLDRSALRRRLGDTLPDFMVPAAFVELERWPLTLNGKLDAEALPVPAVEVAAHRAPATQLERMLAELWATALGSAVAIGLDDNFLALGGDSIAAARVVQRIAQHLSITLSLRDLFGAPTLADLARTVEARSSERPEAPIPARPDGASRVLSFAEEQLYLIARRVPGLPVYSECLLVRLAAALDGPRLRRAFFELGGRHAILRSNYVDDDGVPRRVDSPRPRIPFAWHDLRGLPAGRREPEMTRHAIARVRAGYDLAKEPLLRVDVYALDDADHRLLVSFHHLVLDGAACALLARELGALYGALTAGAPRPATAPAALAIDDLAAWQRGRLGEMKRLHLGYWQERLAGLEDLEMPLDHPRPRVQSFRGARFRRRLPEGLAAGLRGLARAAGVTPFTALLAAFLAVLHRHGGQREVVAGTIAGGRGSPESEQVMGCLINAIVLRQAIAPAMEFHALLAAVRDTLLEAHAHGELPFATLAGELRPVRSPARNPLFQIAFSARVPVPDPLPGWSVDISPFDTGTARFDLGVQAGDRAGTIEIDFEYSVDLFEAATAERIADRYLTLLGALVRDPAVAIGDLPLLDERETRTLLAWGRGTPPSGGVLVLDRFGRQVAERPEAIAAIHEQEALSYRQLDRRADAVAERLAALGVGPETLVGLGAPPSLLWLTGMLGILKSGAAFLPFDPAYPRARLDAMLADAHLEVLCIAGAGREVFAGFSGRLIDLAACHDAGRPPAPRALDRHNLAYAIYTSGSSGVPKAALIEHGCLANLVESYVRLVDLDATDRVAQLMSLSFDGSVLEILPALAVGASLVVAPAAARWHGAETIDLLERHAITAMFSPPAGLTALPDANLPALRSVAAGGEALGARVVERWARGRLMLNCYGPAETTVFALTARCEPDGSQPPIGRPITGACAYVVDERLRLAPIGVPGELWIGGLGVGRGYLHREELTPERFVPDPFSGKPGARVYRTGDLVRFRPDGRVDFLGRLDRQVKLRGFRIEPGEVEAALLGHPAVAQAVAVVRQDRPGDQRLVAYVVPRGGNLDEAALRSFLTGTLPGFMVPSVVVALAALPLSPSGKVDRRALPAPAAVRRSRGCAAATDLERAVAEVWREVLQAAEIGVEVPFFDAGGDSLALARVQARLRARLGVAMDMPLLLRLPTIRALAAHLATLTGEGVKPDPAPPRQAAAPRAGRSGTPIAIVGMSMRGPAVESVEEFWQLLAEGRNAIRFFAPAETGREDHPPSFVPAEGILADADCFDNEFFGVSALDAALSDPQHRVFMEAAWSALEDAGHDPRRFPGRIGVFAGAGLPRHWLGPVARVLAGERTGTLRHRAELWNAAECLTARTASKLHLRGPAVTVQTACSTSLAAVHLARQALLAGDCDMAIAGGVSIASVSPEDRGYEALPGGILSPSGRCRPFSAAADGTVKASGVALVVMKRLADAERDRDQVRALVLGSAMNNDGGATAGFSAPAEEGQSRALEAAYAAAGIDPASVAFVEAHGTGTALGDAAEAAALKRVFRGTASGRRISLTAVKGNIGHLDAAAGAVSLIKATLALEHRTVPGICGLGAANPLLGLAGSPFLLHSGSRRLDGGEAPPRAGVTSIGMGGTNVHVVLEAAPPTAPPAAVERSARLLCLSAMSEAALDRVTAGLEHRLLGASPAVVADTAYTLAVGRAQLCRRRAVVIRRGEEAARALADRSRAIDGSAHAERPVAFLFPGQGAQHLKMGRQLYREYPGYRAALDEALAVLRQETGLDLASFLLHGEPSLQAVLDEPGVAQPATFIVSHALARLLESWGIVPGAVLGHSLGEYAAACLAGVFSLRDALWLVAERGRLTASVGPGAMLSVLAERRELEPHLEPDVSIATEAPGCTVISGPAAAIGAAEERLAARGFERRRLAVTRAYHSTMMRAVRDAFADRVASLTLSAPALPMLSCSGGGWLTGEQATSPSYWADQLCNTVTLTSGLATLLEEPARLFIEVGPGRALRGFLRRHPLASGDTIAVATLPAPGGQGWPEPAFLLQSIGRLWVSGARVDWSGVFAGEARRRVSLPTYPFARRRHQIAAASCLSPLPGPAHAPFRLEEELAAIEAGELALEGELAIRSIDDRPGVRESLSALGAAFVYRYFAEHAQIRPGETSVLAALRAKLRILPKFTRMFELLLSVLHAGGIAEVSEREVRWVREVSAETLRGDFLREHPELLGLIRFLEHCTGAYPQALAGDIEAVGVLYPDGTDAFYRECMGQCARVSAVDLYLRLGREVARATVASVAGCGRKARILEVGAGHGTFTWPFLESLAPDGCEYHFTDIGRSFLSRAQEEAARRGLRSLRTSLLDLDRAPGGQGFAAASFDLVAGFNAVHTARDTARTLAWLHELLVPGGLLVLVEGTRIEIWEQLIWGLAPGFWDFAGSRSSLARSAADWLSLLERSGFTSVARFPSGGRAPRDHVLVLAQREGPPAPPRVEGQPAPLLIEAPPAARPRPAGKPAGPAITGPAAGLPGSPAGLEREIAGVWRRLLGLDAIGPEQDFFELGGDSLMAVQLLAEVRLRLGAEIKIGEFSRTPTVQGMVELLAPRLPAATAAGPVTCANLPQPPTSIAAPRSPPPRGAASAPGPAGDAADQAQLLALAQRYLDLTVAGPAGNEVVEETFVHDGGVHLFDSYDSDVRGFGNIHALYAEEFRAVAAPQIRLYDTSIRIAPGGQAGWLAGRIDSTLTLRRSGRQISFLRTRVTWAFEKHAGAWKVSHVHFSIPVGVPLRMME